MFDEAIRFEILQTDFLTEIKLLQGIFGSMLPLICSEV